METDRIPSITLPPVSPLELRMLKCILGELFNKINRPPDSQYAFSTCDMVFDTHAGMDRALVRLHYKLDSFRVEEARG